MAPDYKTWLMPAYERATVPWRRWRLRCLSSKMQAPIVIFFYHRIADDTRVPWTMSNEQFRRQIEWLRAHCDLISLPEAQRRMREGNRRLAAHVTFDDGYAENTDQAIPLLVELGVPCTYFVTLDQVTSGVPFPHDAQLGEHLPANTIAELQAMAEAGIEIGAHTRTHADLGTRLPPDQLEDEIVRSGDDLEDRLGFPVRYFAFPFGHPENISAAAFRVARNGRYDGVVSAYGGYNYPGDGAFHLLRFGADPRFPRFRNVASYDPRKASIRDHFDRCDHAASNTECDELAIGAAP